MPGGVLEHAGARVQQEDVGGVHAELTGDLAQDDRQDDMQVETGIDGGVDGMQGRNALQVVAHLLGGIDPFGDVADDGDQAGVHGGDQAGLEPARSLRTPELVVEGDHVTGLLGLLERGGEFLGSVGGQDGLHLQADQSGGQQIQRQGFAGLVTQDAAGKVHG